MKFKKVFFGAMGCCMALSLAACGKTAENGTVSVVDSTFTGTVTAVDEKTGTVTLTLSNGMNIPGSAMLQDFGGEMQEGPRDMWQGSGRGTEGDMPGELQGQTPPDMTENPGEIPGGFEGRDLGEIQQGTDPGMTGGPFEGRDAFGNFNTAGSESSITVTVSLKDIALNDGDGNTISLSDLEAGIMLSVKTDSSGLAISASITTTDFSRIGNSDKNRVEIDPSEAQTIDKDKDPEK